MAHLLCWHGTWRNPLDAAIMLRQLRLGLRDWRVTHVAVVVDGMVTEAIRSGQRSLLMRDYPDWHRWSLRRINLDSNGLARAAFWLECIRQNPKPYDYLGALGSGLWSVVGYKFNPLQGRCKRFCSELVMEFYKIGGMPVRGHPAGYLPAQAASVPWVGDDEGK